MKRFACLLLSLCPLAAFAAEPSPYAGQETRAIKALSAEDQSALLAGKGMGLAKAAELNAYPGPVHVLELADELALTASQREQSEALFKRMQARAQTLGRDIVDAEQALDAAFASKRIDTETLAATVNRIGALQAELRITHLATHLDQARILNPDQLARYQQLRGYADTDADAGTRAQHRHGHQH